MDKIGFKIARFGIGVLLTLMLIHLRGCKIYMGGGAGPVLPSGDFAVVLDPDSGHPPFRVKITATDMEAGTYTYEATGKATVQSTENTLGMIVQTWPWVCTVTWTDGLGRVEVQTASIALENSAPVIDWPRVNGIDPSYNANILRELERTVFDWNFFQETPLWPGDQVQRFGIHDPDGADDEPRITNVVVLWYGDGFPGGREVTVYVPPFEEGVYHTTRFIGRGEIVPNSFILYPPYMARWDKKAGRWTCPTPEWSYRPLCQHEKLNIPTSPSVPLTVFVEVEDKYGARSSRLFDFTMDATGCAK